MEEIWKDIEGYEGIYQISNYGRIKSLSRLIENSNNRTTKEKIKEASKDNNVFASNITMCCQRKCNTIGGYGWSYYE